MLCGPMTSALTWTEADSNTSYHYEVPMIRSFDSLHHLTVRCILKTKRQRTCCTLFSTCLFFFLARNHTMDSLRANLVSPCAYILLHVHQLLGNVLVNKFPRRQILCKQSAARLRNNKRDCVFYVVRAEQRWNNGVMHPVSKQRLGKYTSV
jgi:hypothetical protein